MPRLTVPILVALGSTILSGQTPPTQLQFEVASIRPNTSVDLRRFITGM